MDVLLLHLVLYILHMNFHTDVCMNVSIGILTSAGTLGGPSSSGGSTGMMDSEEKYQRDMAYGGSNYDIG